MDSIELVEVINLDEEGYKHGPEARDKMKAAWARRRAVNTLAKALAIATKQMSQEELEEVRGLFDKS